MATSKLAGVSWVLLFTSAVLLTPPTYSEKHSSKTGFFGPRCYMCTSMPKRDNETVDDYSPYWLNFVLPHFQQVPRTPQCSFYNNETADIPIVNCHYGICVKMSYKGLGAEGNEVHYHWRACIPNVKDKLRLDCTLIKNSVTQVELCMCNTNLCNGDAANVVYYKPELIPHSSDRKQRKRELNLSPNLRSDMIVNLVYTLFAPLCIWEVAFLPVALLGWFIWKRHGNYECSMLDDTCITSKEQHVKFDAALLNDQVGDVKVIQKQRFTDGQMVSRSQEFHAMMLHRRSTRRISERPIPLEVIENIVRTAGLSPSGAHRQPWTYAVVSNPELKHCIREMVEFEEKLNYERRMGDKWVTDLKFCKTNWVKPYIDTAPYIILIFKQKYGLSATGEKIEHYYTDISVSISVGILVAAITNVGLLTVTSTPMNAGPAICKLLRRPPNERLLLLLPIGYAADDAVAPDIVRKDLKEIMPYYK